MQRPLPANAEVTFVTSEGKTKSAKIIEQITPGSARLELSENNEAIASHATTGEPGTFYFADEKPAVKEAAKNEGNGPKTPVKPGAEATASNK